MSFILDALRKSESERQREAAPNLARIPLAVHRDRLPRWAILVMALLTVSVVALTATWWSNRAGTVPADATAESGAAATLPAGDRPSPEPPPRVTARAAPPAADHPDRARIAAAEPAPAASAAAEIANDAPQKADPTLPSPAELSAQGIDLPALSLELHSFGESAAQRFVFINGRQYREGNELREGPRLIAIVEDGAVLSHGGRRFLLTPD